MQKRILFVDDDKNLLWGIKRNIKINYDDVIADFEDSPANAVKKLDKTDYNVIVTDYKMPGIDGEMLLNLIQEKRPDIVRIILTGHLEEVLESHYNDPRCYFLQKPVVLSELMAMIELAMEDE
jgi:DNA-binding NtrC family response regulator